MKAVIVKWFDGSEHRASIHAVGPVPTLVAVGYDLSAWPKLFQRDATQPPEAEELRFIEIPYTVARNDEN